MKRPEQGETIAVWFSCGAASAVAAKETLKLYGNTNTVRVLNNYILEEDADNRRFLADVQDWIGGEIEDVRHPKFPSGSAVSVWDAKLFMSSPFGAPCTQILKKEARQLWESKNKVEHHVLGFTLDEKQRHNDFVRTERPLLPVLIDAGITKADCYRILQEAGIKLPRVYLMGYPNANCIGCVKATSPTYWNHVRKHHPHVFEQRARQSEALGAKLVRYKGERIPLTELPPDAVGRPLKNMDFECGIFCEEKRRLNA